MKRTRLPSRRARLATAAFALATLTCAAQAQAPVPAAAPSASSSYYCPVDGHTLPLTALYGDWQLQIDSDPPRSATLQLTPHPDYAGVRGQLRFDDDGSQAALAGDINDDGLLAIDESADGRSISASWQARLQDGSCGRVLEGRRRNATEAIDAPGSPILLRRSAQPAPGAAHPEPPDSAIPSGSSP